MPESDQDNFLQVLLYIASAVRGNILISVRESKQQKGQSLPDYHEYQ